MAGLSSNTVSTLKNLAQSVKNRDQLQDMVNESLLGLLENTPSKSIVADPKSYRILEELKINADMEAELDDKKNDINNKIEYTTAANKNQTALIGIPYNLTTLKMANDTLTNIKNAEKTKQIEKEYLENQIDQTQKEIIKMHGKGIDTSNKDKEQKKLNNKLRVLKMDLKEIDRVIPLLEEYISLKKIYDPIANVLKGGSSGNVSRISEINGITKIMKDKFFIGKDEFKPSLGVHEIDYEKNMKPIKLDDIFAPNTSKPGIQYVICDASNGEQIEQDNDKYEVTTDDGQKIKIKGLSINKANTLNIKNITIDDLQGVKFPVNITLMVRGRVKDSTTGANIDHFKKLNMTINEPKRDLKRRHDIVDTVEQNLDRTYLETRLRQDYENTFNKIQREAFEGVLADNPEFAKLNQTQKDRLYQRLQDSGPLANGPVSIKLGDDASGTTQDYDINGITFSPSTHDYSLMPTGENYEGFKAWLANQAPKDVLNDEEKYRSWMRNGLVASLSDGKTHYQSYFADVAKQFTDDLNVKTTINKTLLDFINDTNHADHVDFDNRLESMNEGLTPETTTTKRRYQRLAFWTQGEKQNRQSLAQGQSHSFQSESITAGGKTFSYSGDLQMKGAQSVTMSLTMQGGKKQVFTAGNPGALVRNLLTNPEIEPPHARFHAGLSVAKSVVKIMRGMGVSLRTPITPEMMDTIPASARYAIENNDNPMLEITEESGNLVAKVFNLNLNTYRKENEYKLFDEQEFTASQSVRDLRQGVESLLLLTNQTMNSVYRQYRAGRFRSGLRPGLLRKPRRGGLRNMYKKLSFSGGSVSAGGKSINLDCKNGLFTFSGGELKKPISGRNLGDLLAYNKELRGLELKTLQVANEKMLDMYQDKLKKQNRIHNYGVIDEENHRVYIYDKHGNLGYYNSNDQEFVSRWRQYTSGRRYGRIADDHMPAEGFTVIKEGNTVIDTENYNNFLLNETLVGSMVRSMSRTHRAWTTRAPW